jgi:hypothetical protein
MMSRAAASSSTRVTTATNRDRLTSISAVPVRATVR